MRSAPVPEPVRRASTPATERSETTRRSPSARARSARTAPRRRSPASRRAYLWVRGAEPVCDAVRDCWASLFSPPAISYRLGSGAREPAAMGVAVQLMVDAAVSGVMFTCNPVSGDPSMVAINASWGLGCSRRRRRGDARRLPRSARSPARSCASTCTQNRSSTCPTPRGREPPGWTCPSRDVARAASTTRRSRSWLELARRIERHFGSHQDIEWAIDHDGHAFVVQSRPVTGLRPRDAQPMPADALSMVMNTFGAHRSDGP